MATTIRSGQFKNFDEEVEDAVGTSISGVGGITVIYQDEGDLILISGSSTPSGDYVTTDGTTPLTGSWNTEQAIQVTSLGIGVAPSYPIDIQNIYGDQFINEISLMPSVTGTLATDQMYVGISISPPLLSWDENGFDAYYDGYYANIAPWTDSHWARGGIFGAVNHQAVTMDLGIGVYASIDNLDAGGTVDVGKAVYASINNLGTIPTSYLFQGQYTSGGSSITSDFKGSSIEVSSNAGTIESAILFNGTTTAAPGAIGSLRGAYFYLYSSAADCGIHGVDVELQPGAGRSGEATSVSEEIGFWSFLSTADGPYSTIYELTGAKMQLAVYGNAAGAPTTSLAHGYYVVLDTMADSVVNTSYAFYGMVNAQGTITDNWGIYITGVDKNYLDGDLIVNGDISGNIDFSSMFGAPDYNVIFGFEAFTNISGDRNVIIGRRAGYNEGDGGWIEKSIVIGDFAAGDTNNLSYNIIIGRGAFEHSGHDGEIRENIAIGNGALCNAPGGSSVNNIAIGELAMAGGLLSAGTNNTSIGKYAGANLSTGSYNVIIGDEAGSYANSSNAICIGTSAGRGDPAGDHTGNILIGNSTATSINSGGYNVVIGDNTGGILSDGSFNVFIGSQAGTSTTTGVCSVFLGYQSGFNETGSNKLYISNSDTSSPLIYGEFDNTLVRINGDLEVTGTISGVASFSSLTDGYVPYYSATSGTLLNSKLKTDGTRFEIAETNNYDVVLSILPNCEDVPLMTVIDINTSFTQNVGVESFQFTGVRINPYFDPSFIPSGLGNLYYGATISLSTTGNVAQSIGVDINNAFGVNDVAATIGELFGTKTALYIVTNGTTVDYTYGNSAVFTVGADVAITESYLYYGSLNNAGTITNNWGIYISGADKNYLAGNLTVDGDLEVIGTVSGSSSYIGSHLTIQDTNVLVGKEVASKNAMTGTYNVAAGYRSGYGNSGAGDYSNSVFVGSKSGYFARNGDYNVGLGADSCGVRDGNYNVAVGYAAGGGGYYDGDGNVCVGANAGALMTNVSYNTAIGHEAGAGCVTGSGNVFVGKHAGYNETGSNKLYIENSDSSSPLIYGEFDNDIIKINGSFYTGSSSNYTTFDNTGHQTMSGTAKPWDDLRVEPVARTVGTNAPTFEKWYDDAAGTSRGVYLYSFDDASEGSEKEVHFTMQMPHSWDGGNIYMHVHWVGAVADTSAAPRWGMEYIWKDVSEVFGDTTIVYNDGNNYTVSGTDTNIVAHKHYISKFAALTPGTTADGISSILIGRLFRNSSNAADTYNESGAKCGLLYIDAHFQLSSVGSTDEYTK